MPAPIEVMSMPPNCPSRFTAIVFTAIVLSGSTHVGG